MRGVYTGGLKVELKHDPSGAVIHTAAPADNNGDGSSFSPTDLVAAGLASCIITTMGIVAEREKIPFAGATFSFEKHMRSDPRRIDRVPIRIEMPAGLDEKQRRKLEFAGRACPVFRSLAEDMEKEVDFIYPD